MDKLSGNELFSVLTKLHKLHLSVEGFAEPKQHEANPQLPPESRENYLYFFLSCSLNYQRNSHNLWKSALATYLDEDTRYVFFPEYVVTKDSMQVAYDMEKHKLALQRNKHPNLWIRICKTLAQEYDNNPKQLLAEGNYSIRRIIEILQTEKKEQFPYLSGLKLSNYMLMILHYYTDVRFIDLYELSIIVDTHIRKTTELLGLTTSNASQKEIENIWREILAVIQIPPHEMHPTLWRWSRSSHTPTLDDLRKKDTEALLDESQARNRNFRQLRLI